MEVPVTVQRVRASWTKRSRGGEAAARRNAVPVGYALPDGAPPLAHIVEIREWEDLTPCDDRAELRHVSAELRRVDGRLGVFPHGTGRTGWTPSTSPVSR
jgi:hypothetical protein